MQGNKEFSYSPALLKMMSRLGRDENCKTQGTIERSEMRGRYMNRKRRGNEKSQFPCVTENDVPVGTKLEECRG
jgi:hypothetical protein